MSRKNKSQKFQSIPNPIMFHVSIDTDDDFTIDGETQLSRNITVTKNGDATLTLIDHLQNLHFESSTRNAQKVTDFKKMLNSLDFVTAIRNLQLPSEHFDYASKVRAGGNQSIVVTLPDLI